MAYDTNVTIRTSTEIKHDAQKIFASLGLDFSTAVNMFLRQVIIRRGMPFKIELDPDDEIVDGFDDETLHGPFYSAEELMRDFNFHD